MTQVTGAWLTNPDTQHLFSLFSSAGHQLFCVGGCVRNAVLHEPVADIDMATNAHPETVSKLCRDAGLKVVPTGIDHGTVTVISGETSFEITTFRTDVTTDGRHATIAFSKTLEEDASRRDFTMNALYVGADGLVIDPTGGIQDIAVRRVKFIGDPQARIAEDYLRILRFFRFHAWYGDPEGGVDEDGLAACAQGAGGLDGLSRERVGSEMTKLLAAPDPAPAVASMAQTGILARVMPGADAGTLAVLVHFEDGIAPDWTRRALALGGEDLKDGWRISKSDAKNMAQAQADLSAGSSVKALAFRHGAEHARNVALVMAASTQQPLAVDLEAQIDRAAKAVFPVSASNLMPNLEGPALGDKLRDLQDRWIASDFTLSREELLAL